MLTVTFTVFAILGGYSAHTNPGCITAADTAQIGVPVHTSTPRAQPSSGTRGAVPLPSSEPPARHVESGRDFGAFPPVEHLFIKLVGWSVPKGTRFGARTA